MIERLPLYVLAKATNTSPPLPMNYTLGLTYKCNSRCKTCRVYDRDNTNELTVIEWQKVFRDLGSSPYWVTFTGGEPFLYPDLLEVYYDLCETCHPKLINIPTNGLLTERVADLVWQMCKIEPKTSLTVNVSIDHISEDDDEIRGVPKAFDKAVATVLALKALKLENLNVGVHTVISKFNADDFAVIRNTLSTLLTQPSLYITEIAENRNELGTMNLDIAPTAAQYEYAISCLESHATLKGLLRSKYYKLVIQWLQTKKRPTPCYAGYASCQITPNGDVWFCCVNAKSIGNIRKEDFATLWKGFAAQQLRRLQRCSCPLANVSYTNIILNPRTVLQTVLGR